MNGGSFRLSATLGSYVLLYVVSSICTWGYARDDRREVALADKSQLLEYQRGSSGPLVRSQALSGCVRPSNHGGDVRQVERANVCAKTQRPKECGPRQACRQEGWSFSGGRATRAGCCEISSGAPLSFCLSDARQVWPALSCKQADRVASVKVVETLSGPIVSGRLRCRWCVKNLLRAVRMDGRGLPFASA